MLWGLEFQKKQKQLSGITQKLLELLPHRMKAALKVFSKSLDLAVDLGDIYKKQNLKFLLNFIKNSASGISVTIRYLI